MSLANPVGHGFGHYDRHSHRILIFGGVKSSFLEPLTLDLENHEFKITPWMFGIPDRFYYNNYAVVDSGKRVIVLGRAGVHLFDCEDVGNSQVIGQGYDVLLN